MKIKILLVNFSERNRNLFEGYFSKDLYEVQSIDYKDGIYLGDYNCDLIIIDNSNSNMDFKSLFANHNKDFLVNVALFLYGGFNSIEGKYFKYFDDILAIDNDAHLIKAKIFSMMRYYLKLNEAKMQNKFNNANFDDIYESGDCRVVFIGDERKIFDDVSRVLSDKVLSIDFLEYKNYYDDFLVGMDYDYDLIFISGADSIHQLVYFYSKIKANKNLKNGHILYIKRQTDLIFPADIINVGINNFINYPIDDKELLGQTIVQLKNKKHFDNFEKSIVNAVDYAWRDGLTDLFNKRYLNFLLENLEKTDNFNRDIGLILIDIDGFKKINDEYGHALGDEILKEIAAILQSVSDENIIATRFGGDEFCVVVMDHGKNLEEREKKVRDLIAYIENSVKDKLFTEKQLKLSLSTGYTMTKEGDLFIDLISRADRDMYENKMRKKI